MSDNLDLNFVKNLPMFEKDLSDSTYVGLIVISISKSIFNLQDFSPVVSKQLNFFQKVVVHALISSPVVYVLILNTCLQDLQIAVLSALF